MKEIIAAIEQKKRDFAQLPLFEFMRDKSIDPLQRLAFAPCVTPFIMGFGDLNKHVFRDEPTTDKIQAIINEHTYEDDRHWLWFLEDIEKLGLNHSLKFNDAVKFLWGKDASFSHFVIHELYRLTFQASPIQKLVVTEVNEATGNVLFTESSKVIHEIVSKVPNTQDKYRYFGSGHLTVEPGHTYCSPEAQQVVENTHLTEAERSECMKIVDKVFALFTGLTNEMLSYAKSQNISHAFSTTCLFSSAVECELDYLIIGAGPAGIQLGYFLEQAKRNYLILEAGASPATSFKQFPRHRQLISINKRYTGYDDPEIKLRWDWNSLLSNDNELLFTDYSKDYFPDADALVQYLGDFVNRFKLNIEYDRRVTSVTKDGTFKVTDSQGKVYACKRLIIATGLAKPYLPPIPGIELAENYTDVSVDPEDFKNQRVLIIGKGNSGFETADRLAATTAAIHVVSPTSITMAWKSRYVGHLRAVNNSILDTYQLKSQNVILDAFVGKIAMRDDGKYVVSFSYTHADSEQEDLIYDRVIVCTGFRFDTSIFDETCLPELTINNRFPRQTSSWESTNVKDLYFAGVLMHMRDFKKKASGFIHGFRYNIRALYRVFEQKYHQQAWPCRKLEPTATSLTEAVLQRVNRSSALWQQTGFLCDLIVVPGSGEAAQYYEEVPTDFIHDSEWGQSEHYYTVTLEFGYDILETIPDPFAIPRVHKDDIDNSALSTGIHPIIRHYHGSTLVAEHHVIEDIASEWCEDIHEQPLQQFFQEKLAMKGKKRIGTYLMEAGLVTAEQLEEALAEQTRISMPLGKLLASRGWVSQQTIEFMMEKVIEPERKFALTN
ncbi:NAD(P)-binding domain-containing protein [Pseudanabaena sp. PCC 6802]|uniref:NAD(P)-binding domain-containing protein n=1 Tax=Pseudanabaena sp. PCC 6802 TaxID=118173 RepID=UPI000349DC7D|nr:NAD(P)-binding domain-containing protein [Pseudanabaena sp. PCC 6802]